jgi:hypothetical protein
MTKHAVNNIISLSILFFLFVFSTSVQAEESQYDFDMSQFEKKPYEFGGLAGLTPALILPDQEAASYRLKYFQEDDLPNLMELLNLELMLEGSYRSGNATLKGRVDSFLDYDGLEWDHRIVVQEAFLSVQDSPAFVVNAGKKVMKWGKGYAFNPVAFLDRPKDPNDPELTLEGFYMAQFDFIRSFQGALTTLAITPVFVPILGTANEELSDENGPNAALKLYFLLWDTDIDLMGMAGVSVAPRYGMDISRNIISNLEVHGEAAFRHDEEKVLLTSNGELKDEKRDVVSSLAGVRYLAPTNTTFIFEYYFDQSGYDKEQTQDFYSFTQDAYQIYEESENDKPIKMAGKASKNGYGHPYPMCNYGYARITHPEPFDIVYLSLAFTGMINIDDGSFSVFPEVGYAGVENFEFRFKAGAMYGPPESEFGEKASDFKADLRMRYFF